MATETIRVVVTQEGARAVRRDIEGIATGADKASSGVGKLAGVLKGIVAAAAVRETIRLADAYTDLTNRIRTVTRAESEMRSVRAELFRIANATRGSVTDLGAAYGRLALTTQSLGLSQREVLELTESLQQATVLSGASAAQAGAAMVQLAQGMGSGALRGDELNSVLENTPVIAQVIAEHLGVTVGQLRSMGAEGKITGRDIVDAFREAREELAERFGKSVPTVAQSTTVLMNVITELVGVLDEASGGSAALSGSVLGLADTLDRLTPILRDIVEVFSEVDSFRGIWDDLAPGPDGVSMLKAFALWAAATRDVLANVFSGLVDMAHLGSAVVARDLDAMKAAVNSLATVRGTPTADALAARFSERRGVTTVNDHLLDQKPTTRTGSSAAAATKGATFASIREELRIEADLLKMSNSEREVATELLRVRDQLEGKLRGQQLTELATLIRHNQELRVANDLSERLGERMGKAMSDAAEARRLEGDRISRELGERMSRQKNEAASRGDFRRRDFEGVTEQMRQDQLNSLQTFGEQMAEIFGPGGTIEKGLGNIGSSMADIIGHAIAFGDSWEDIERAVENLGRTILAEVISGLIKTGVQMGINAALGQSLTAAAVGTSVASAKLVSAAWATPAAFVSTATLGAGGAAGVAGLTAAVASAKTMSLASVVGFADGGYTGSGANSGEVAGVVHRNEFVLNAAATRRLGLANLQAANDGRAAPAAGGGVNVTIINQASGVEHDVRQIDDAHIEIVARRVVAQTAPDVIANDMRNPYGKTGKAVMQTTTARRRSAQ